MRERVVKSDHDLGVRIVAIAPNMFQVQTMSRGDDGFLRWHGGMENKHGEWADAEKEFRDCCSERRQERHLDIKTEAERVG